MRTSYQNAWTDRIFTSVSMISFSMNKKSAINEGYYLQHNYKQQYFIATTEYSFFKEKTPIPSYCTIQNYSVWNGSFSHQTRQLLVEAARIKWFKIVDNPLKRATNLWHKDLS